MIIIIIIIKYLPSPRLNIIRCTQRQISVRQISGLNTHRCDQESFFFLNWLKQYSSIWHEGTHIQRPTVLCIRCFLKILGKYQKKNFIFAFTCCSSFLFLMFCALWLFCIECLCSLEIALVYLHSNRCLCCSSWFIYRRRVNSAAPCIQMNMSAVRGVLWMNAQISWIWCWRSWLDLLPLVVFFQPLQLSLSIQSPLGLCLHLLSLHLHLPLSLLQLGFTIQEVLVPWDWKYNIHPKRKKLWLKMHDRKRCSVSNFVFLF